MEASTRRRSKLRGYSRESRHGDLNGRAGAAQRRAISFSRASRGFHVVLLPCWASEVPCPEPERHQYINVCPGISLAVRYLSLLLVSSILTVTFVFSFYPGPEFSCLQTYSVPLAASFKFAGTVRH